MKFIVIYEGLRVAEFVGYNNAVAFVRLVLGSGKIIAIASGREMFKLESS